MTRGQLRDTCQFLLRACGEPCGSSEPGIILARTAVFSDFCAVKHIRKIVWGAIMRVKIVLLGLKIHLVCYFPGIFDVLGLREAQRVYPSIVLLKMRRAILV